MTERDAFLTVLEHYLGTPYRWGGDDPSGVDCSGLVIVGLKGVGKLPWKGDWTANGLLQIGKDAGWEVKRPDLREGCLVFFLNEIGKATHVEIVWRNPKLSIGASGGGPGINNPDDAARKNAFVQVHPWGRRPGPYAFVDPFRQVEAT